MNINQILFGLKREFDKNLNRGIKKCWYIYNFINNMDKLDN